MVNLLRVSSFPVEENDVVLVSVIITKYYVSVNSWEIRLSVNYFISYCIFEILFIIFLCSFPQCTGVFGGHYYITASH